MLFDEDLVRPQCFKCNMYGNGEGARFALYLRGWEGKTDEELNEYLERKHKTVKYSAQDYKDIAESYENKCHAIREIKKI